LIANQVGAKRKSYCQLDHEDKPDSKHQQFNINLM